MHGPMDGIDHVYSKLGGGRAEQPVHVPCYAMRFIGHLPIGRRVIVKHHRPTDGYAFKKSLAWAH